MKKRFTPQQIVFVLRQAELGTLVSACFKAKTICASVNRCFMSVTLLCVGGCNHVALTCNGAGCRSQTTISRSSLLDGQEMHSTFSGKK